MRRIGASVVGFALSVGLLIESAPAVAGPPNADTLRRAAASFDEGTRAYRAEDYGAAASHFEAADLVAPSAKALRLAMRARDRAGHSARAATLAELALLRHPDDANTAAAASEVLDAHEGALHRVKIHCSQPCVVAVGARGVLGAARKTVTVWLDPGRVTVSASFDDAGSDSREVVTVAGGRDTLELEPQAAESFYESESPTLNPVAPDDPAPSDPAPSDPAPSDPAPSGQVSTDQVSTDQVSTDQAPGAQDPLDEPSWITSPAVFVTGLVVTLGVGGTTIWSGFDTIDNPGEATVRGACAGKGTDCPEYQEGLANQTRTNVLIGVTAGTALLTGIIGIGVTDWGDDDPSTARVRLRAAIGRNASLLNVSMAF